MASKVLMTVLYFVLLLTVAAADSSDESCEEEEVIDALSDRADLFFQLIKDQDADTLYSEIYTPDSRVAAGPLGSFQGEEIRDHYQTAFGKGMKELYIPEGSPVHQDQCCDFAVRRGLSVRVVNDTERTTRWIEEWRKEAVGWRVSYYQWTFFL